MAISGLLIESFWDPLRRISVTRLSIDDQQSRINNESPIKDHHSKIDSDTISSDLSMQPSHE
jgi:hypothetical protein